jgi:asparagine synthase (glutamine-hydrolysing)
LNSAVGRAITRPSARDGQVAAARPGLHFRGSADLRQLSPRLDESAMAHVRDRQRIAAPGLELEWDPREVDVAIRDDVLALVAGEPQAGESEGRSARPSGLEWLDRYRRWDLDAAKDARGAYAVILIDMRRRRLLAMVDVFSIRPLCHTAKDSTISFASTCCDVPGTPPEFDPQSIYDYLYFHVIPAPQTVFANIQRLPPAHRLVATVAQVTVEPYWTPVFVEDDRDNLAERKEAFVRIIARDVRREADVPATACFLSGGTDSSTVAGILARSRQGAPVHAYSIGFTTSGYDETSYARIAARHFKLEHHEYYITPDDLVRSIPDLAAASDQPFGNSSVLPTYYCAVRAREDGFRKLLAGDGGDELFGGNSRYATQSLLQLYQRVPAALRPMIERPSMEWRAFRSIPGLRQIGGYVRHARIPMPDRAQSFNLLNEFDTSQMFDPAFLASVDVTRPLAQQRATWNAITATSLVNRMLAYDWKYTLADNDLPKVRLATQAAGMAVGYPLLSRDLLDFSLALPPDWKLRGLRLRWFFKEALSDFLPVEILRKKKHGFGLPFGHWLLQHKGLRDLAGDSLASVSSRGIVQPSFRDTLYRKLPDAPGYYGELIWILMMLEQWLAARYRN